MIKINGKWIRCAANMEEKEVSPEMISMKLKLKLKMFLLPWPKLRGSIELT